MAAVALQARAHAGLLRLRAKHHALGFLRPCNKMLRANQVNCVKVHTRSFSWPAVQLPATRTHVILAEKAWSGSHMVTSSKLTQYWTGPVHFHAGTRGLYLCKESFGFHGRVINSKQTAASALHSSAGGGGVKKEAPTLKRGAIGANSETVDVGEGGLEEEWNGEEEEEDVDAAVELTEEEQKELEAELGKIMEAAGIDTSGGVKWEIASDEEEFEEEEEDTQPGDGLDGGGLVVGDAAWAPQVLSMAQGLLQDAKFSTRDLSLYGFRAYPERNMVKIRLEKTSDEWGSPSIDDLEDFMRDLYGEVQKAEARNDLPEIQIEVSTPGAERVVNVPEDLERFAHSPMYVCYLEPPTKPGSNLKERHEVYEFVEVDADRGAVVWKLADVRVNREMMGKGRRLNKKQRETRISVPFQDIKVVRLYLDV